MIRYEDLAEKVSRYHPDAPMELIQRGAQHSDLLSSCGLKHICRDIALMGHKNGNSADQCADGNRILMVLDGNEYGVFGAVCDDIAQEVGGITRCEFHGGVGD